MNNKIIFSFLAALTVTTTAAPMIDPWSDDDFSPCARDFRPVPETPLHLAARRGDVEGVTALLKEGADIDAKQGYDLTPLHYASESGHADCVKILLEWHADVDAQDRQHDTPLHRAVLRGYIGCVGKLLESGAYVDGQNSDGKTPLHLAAQWGRADDIATILLKHGADVNAESKAGKTPAMLAEKYGHHELAKYLKEVAASLEIKEPDVEQEKQ
ncbi:ankyrin repeat domain-containing protein [bacterium]|nr:MAG: ankyrin repeat domain-containing protein [bacterium]